MISDIPATPFALCRDKKSKTTPGVAPRIRTTVTDLLEVRDMNILQQITKLINTGDLTVVHSNG